MKKLLLLTLTFILVTINAQLKASHLVGGEITWECTGNGRYVFKMKIYRDCTGIDYTFIKESLTITGSPLPRDSNNQTINSITLNPDTAFDISPSCDALGYSIGCFSNINDGAYQEFRYQSDPVYLKGVPPVAV
jgi:hypothetical protein